MKEKSARSHDRHEQIRIGEEKEAICLHLRQDELSPQQYPYIKSREAYMKTQRLTQGHQY